jgi:hypothetical protein
MAAQRPGAVLMQIGRTENICAADIKSLRVDQTHKLLALATPRGDRDP